MRGADYYVVALMLGSGASIAAFWLFLIGTGRVRAVIPDARLATYHIAAEWLTSLLLIAGALAWIAHPHASYVRPLAGLGLGALLYALSGSAGFYKQKWMVAVFPAGLAFAIPAMVLLLRR